MRYLLPQQLAAPNFEADVLPYIQANCVRCHGPAKQEGEFRIDQLSKKYTGDIYKKRQPGEVRVTYKIRPDRVFTMG